MSERADKESLEPMTDELTSDDFADYDLPSQPLHYQPEYRKDVRCFAIICFGVAVLLIVLMIHGPV